jgi:hypothetical protein
MTRYFTAALINTILGLTILAILYRVTYMPYVTIGLSTVFGYIYSLFTYHRIAFKGRAGKPPYCSYAVVYGTAFMLNSLLTIGALRMTSNFLLAQVVILPLVVVMQWAASNFWAFRSKPQ